jgi:hypothetical protein
MKNLVYLAALALGACAPSPAPSSPEKPEMQLRFYEVPPSAARDLRNALNSALEGGKESKDAVEYGRASVAPDGRLMLLAPERMQQSVATMMEQVAKHPNVPPTRIDMSYWFVAGKHGTGETPAELAELKPALDEIVRAQGPTQFRELEKLKLSSLSGGDSGSVHGASVDARQRLTMAQGMVLAELRLSRGSLNLDTTVHIKPGQLLVLGQSGFLKGANEEGDALFYIIRADVHDAGPESR